MTERGSQKFGRTISRFNPKRLLGITLVTTPITAFVGLGIYIAIQEMGRGPVSVGILAALFMGAGLFLLSDY